MADEITELQEKLKQAKEQERQRKKKERENEYRKQKEKREREKRLHREEAEMRKRLKRNKRKKDTKVLNVAAEKGTTIPVTEASQILPIEKIVEGVVFTTDHRYIKILEVIPINFLLRSALEQRSILYSFMGFLKISPIRMQIKMVSKKANINQYLERIDADIRKERDERCRMLQRDYRSLITSVGQKEAVSRRFFLIFEYEADTNDRARDEKAILFQLNSVASTIAKYLGQCGNEVVTPVHQTMHIMEIFYTILNRRKSVRIPLQEHMDEITQEFMSKNKGGKPSILDLVAPRRLDFTHSTNVVIDGVYYTFLFIPSAKYKSKVPAGWMSILINAGEGIDVDLFVYRQDRTRSMERIGRRIRINKSKIKEASDTNTDFDDLEESIRAGYYLKNGLSGNEDLYYISILLTVTGNSEKEVEWRSRELKKLLISKDMDCTKCFFRQEQAFQSALPLLNLDKNLFSRSKRNVLTSGLGSCYPFVSFEMSDDNGILMGVNKANSSLVIVDIFNSQIYKNANIAIMGTSGAGKTFTLQLMALRMRRKNIQVFIIAPDKGHEFARACTNIGGEFIQIAPASSHCINVMEIRQSQSDTADVLDGEVMNSSKLALKIQDLHIFFSLLVPDMNYEERQLLDEAFITTYERKGITHDNESLWEKRNPGKYKEMPVLGDLYRVLREREETKRLANILNRLVNGSARSFNQQTNVNLDNKYIVLDISQITGDLLTVGMFIALDYVWSKAKEDRTVEKAIFIDEVWQLIGATSTELAAEYVLEIFKIIRGYGGSAVCATQDTNDFFSLKDGKYGRGIINNAKTKIILNMENNEAEQIRDVLHLSDAEMMSIIKFNRGNGLISTNNNNMTVEFKASQLEKDLITTDRKDLQELKDRLKQHGADAFGRG